MAKNDLVLLNALLEQKIDDDFLDAVHCALPQQPWPKHIHQSVATTLKCSPKLVERAIRVLIHRGRWHHQINGLIVKAFPD